MAYHTNEDGKQVWIPQRDTRWMGDPLRHAGERLADRVETYLFDTASPVYMDPVYLSWAVAQYDVEKGGTGNYAQMNPEFDRDSFLHQPFEGKPPASNPEMQKNVAVHAPQHVLDALVPAEAPVDTEDAS